MIDLDERQRRLLDAHHKSIGFVAPELQRERLEDLVEELLLVERERCANKLDASVASTVAKLSARWRRGGAL